MSKPTRAVNEPIIVSINGSIATMSTGDQWWLNGPMQTRPQDWAPKARAYLFPEREREKA